MKAETPGPMEVPEDLAAEFDDAGRGAVFDRALRSAGARVAEAQMGGLPTLCVCFEERRGADHRLSADSFG